jgi:hypothetical protein
VTYQFILLGENGGNCTMLFVPARWTGIRTTCMVASVAHGYGQYTLTRSHAAALLRYMRKCRPYVRIVATKHAQ